MSIITYDYAHAIVSWANCARATASIARAEDEEEEEPSEMDAASGKASFAARSLARPLVSWARVWCTRAATSTKPPSPPPPPPVRPSRASLQSPERRTPTSTYVVSFEGMLGEEGGGGGVAKEEGTAQLREEERVSIC